MSGNETIIDLLRHGACEEPEPVFRGRIDSQLSPLGQQQMQAAIDHVNGDWRQVISSPLSRCRHFAEALADQKGLPFAVDDDFQEIDFGRWDGCEVSTIWDQEPKAVERFYQYPDETPHGGESISALRQRVIAGWKKLLLQHQGSHVLVVQHGGTMMVLLAEILQIPLTNLNALDVPYACISRVKVFHHGDDWQAVVQFHNRLDS